MTNPLGSFIRRHREKHRLSYRMLFMILLCSSFFTIMVTALQLYVDYRSDIKSIRNGFKQIEASFVEPLSVSLWNFNRTQIQSQISGLLSLPDIQYLEVKELRGDEEHIIARAGDPGFSAGLTHSYLLQFQQRDKIIPIGKLVVKANLENIYRRLKEKVFFILAAQMVKTLIVSFLILAIFQFFLIRHLNTIAVHLGELSPDREEPHLDLKRRSLELRKPDALDYVVISINRMKDNLYRFISERYKAENEIRHLRNYLANIINSMPTILIGVDINGRITQWNSKTISFSQVSEEKIRGMNFTKLFPFLKYEHLNILKVIQDHIPYKSDKISWKAGRDQYFFNLLVYPLREGEFDEAIVMIDDITERVRMEDLIIQTEKMMSIGGLAAGMAHEINNPLGGILQGTQNVIRRLSADIPANVKTAEACDVDFNKIKAYVGKREILDNLAGIQKSGERAAKIVNNMMKFSRPGKLERHPVDLATLLDATIELANNDYDLRKHYDFKHVKINRDYDKNLKPVSCIETEIEQVFFNLMKNAAQALSSSDKDVVPQISVRTMHEDGMARVEIEDNGPGMAEETRRRVFEPFFTTKQVGEGTGLGLSVSYMIVTNIHNGTIELHSEPGKGTLFIIRLPY